MNGEQLGSSAVGLCFSAFTAAGIAGVLFADGVMAQTPLDLTRDSLPLGATVRFVVQERGPNWLTGTVSSTVNPRCTVILTADGLSFLLAAVDTLELLTRAGGDTVWRPVNILAALAREAWCPQSRSQGSWVFMERTIAHGPGNEFVGARKERITRR
jgi:hypothetical protein